MKANPNDFSPPSADRLAKHLADHPPIPPSPWRGRGPMLALIAVALVIMLTGHPALAFLPWIAIVTMMIVLVGRANRTRQLHARTVRAWELAMLRRHREALRAAWALLAEARPYPELQARAITVMAHCLDELAQHEAATVALNNLLGRMDPNHPMAAQLRVQRAQASLCTDHLADGDEALRKLRGRIDQLPTCAITASYHLTRLVQDVRTGHFADACSEADQTAQKLLPLGVDAGYGYGLLALCEHQLALRENDDAAADDRNRRSESWWRKATLLIPPAALVYRHAELMPLLSARPIKAT